MNHLDNLKTLEDVEARAREMELVNRPNGWLLATKEDLDRPILTKRNLAIVRKNKQLISNELCEIVRAVVNNQWGWMPDKEFIYNISDSNTIAVYSANGEYHTKTFYFKGQAELDKFNELLGGGQKYCDMSQGIF